MLVLAPALVLLNLVPFQTLAPEPRASFMRHASTPRAVPSWGEQVGTARVATAEPTSQQDVFFLSNGDRITGKTLTAGRRSFVIQTPFGRLTIPRARVERIRHADGTEEILNPSPEPREPPTPKARLILIVLGKTFWQAWDPREAVDPTLRLEVRLDEEALGAYVDARPDPEEIPKAVVNSFSFRTEDIALESGRETTLLPPEARPGRIVLKIVLPVALSGTHRLRLAYQVNAGSASEPAWKDLVEGSTVCELRSEAPTFVRVRQDAGRMEFSGFPKRRMKLVETFRLELTTDNGEAGS